MKHLYLPLKNSFWPCTFTSILCCLSFPIFAERPNEGPENTPIEYTLGKHYQSILSQARRLSEAAMFAESVPYYERILEGIEKKECSATLKKKDKDRLIAAIYYQLAEAYFNDGNYNQTIAVLHPKIEEWKQLSRQEITEDIRKNLYLIALACRAKGDFELASQYFQDYLRSGEKEQLLYYEEAQWELGVALYALGNSAGAQEYWQALAESSTKPHIIKLARVYLARKALLDQKYHEVDQWLLPLFEALTEKASLGKDTSSPSNSESAGITPDDPLRYEIAYLKAEAAFYLQNYMEAAKKFEESLPRHNKKLADWYSRALYNLGWSYLKMAEDPLKSKTCQEEFFTQAEETFLELLSSIRQPFSTSPTPLLFKDAMHQTSSHPKDPLEEKTILALARLHLLRHVYLNDEHSYSEIDALLSQAETFNFLENRAEALYIRAEAAETYEQKARLYQALTDSKMYQGTPSYQRGWYCRAINEYQHAGLLREMNDPSASESFTHSAQAFQTSYEILRNSDKAAAGLSLKYQAQAFFYLGSPEALARSLSLLDQIVNEQEIFEAIEEKDEVLYCLGLVASQLFQYDQEEKYEKIAEHSLHQVVRLFPDSAFADDALFTLANLYLQNECYENAQPVFLALAKKYPSSIYASEAWFWAAHCAEETEPDEENARHFRRQVFELYPQSQHAGEAYFRTYSFAEYLHGDSSAFAHLQAMEALFPDSPFIIVAKYLLGLDQKEDRKTPQGQLLHPKSLPSALEALESAKATFDLFFEKKLIPEEHLDYLINIRYRALLAHSLILLSLAEDSPEAEKEKYLNGAADDLEIITMDFRTPEHKLTSRLLEADAYPRIYEESQFALAQVYLKKQQEDNAEKILSEMLNQYKSLEVASGYYLSRTWYELALITMNKGKFETALHRFDQAEYAGRNAILTVEQKLDLWIQKSHCYRNLKQTNMAMLMLSHVINENATSSLRIKAMVLRADLYALQGRHELAIKQLEAASRKGGEWAQEAKEKLRKEYGFD